MTEDIGGLIDRIQQEGIEAAETKARDIEARAQTEAGKIIEAAKKEAEQVIKQAKGQALRHKQSTEDMLKQTARDMILSLKKEINHLLDKIIASKVRQALTPGEMAKIIANLIKSGHDKDKIIISLHKDDLEKLKKGLLSSFKDEAKKGITLRCTQDFAGGFQISYDAGRSFYDFSDKALADYIGSYLKPQLAEILQK